MDDPDATPAATDSEGSDHGSEGCDESDESDESNEQTEGPLDEGSTGDDDTDPPDTVMDVDGNVYGTVAIGDQVWMTDNLRVTALSDGTPLFHAAANEDWTTTEEAAYSWYGNDESNAEPYGALYNAYAASTPGLCPEGWHVASDADWTTLSELLGEGAGGMLKDTGVDHWDSPNEGATDALGFAAVPGGLRSYVDGQFMLIRIQGGYWTSTPTWLRSMQYDNASLERHSEGGRVGRSVRCMQDPS